MNQARVLTEKTIDKLYKPLRSQLKNKPKTYRKKARKNYLKIARQRKPRKKALSRAIVQQLQYIKRNLSHIEKLLIEGASLSYLSKREYKNLLVTAEVYRQQLWMYEFNESNDFIERVELFQEQTGYYPESVHVDKIYRTRKNRAFCQEKGIRISGVPLGRPPKNISNKTKQQAQEDERTRNAIEGKFGQGKRRFTLNKIMTKLPSTSAITIAIIFLVMNLSALLKEFLYLFFVKNLLKRFLINKNYSLSNY